MLLTQFITVPLWGLGVSAYLVTPPGTAFPEADSDCSGWVAVTSGMTCAEVEADAGITEAQFEAWNPLITELSSTCSLEAGFDYCIQVNFGSTSTAPTSTATSATATPTTLVTTTSGDGISTPSPIQTGMVSTCDGFWQVSTNETCDSIVAAVGISLTDFYTWNPAVGSSCESLGLGDYVCVDVIGYTFTTSPVSASATTTAPNDGVSTPSPIQTGMVSTCDKFYLVVEGDTCQGVADDAGIPLATFYSWNPAVGTSCAGLGLGDYVCVDIIGYTATTSPASTTTTPADGISTPTPIQTGMVSTCDKFYLVVEGDTCQGVADDAGISLATFYSWNPAVGTSCAGLGLGDYVCIDIIGYTATATTTSVTTTSSAGNGVTTPTNIETGMVNDCDKFYYVESGDTCASIATAAGVTSAEIISWNPTVGSTCTGLWLNYYICVGIL